MKKQTSQALLALSIIAGLTLAGSNQAAQSETLQRYYLPQSRGTAYVFVVDPYLTVSYSQRVQQSNVAQVLSNVFNGQTTYGISEQNLITQLQRPYIPIQSFQVGKPLPLDISKQAYYLPYTSYPFLGIPNGYRAAIYNDNLVLMNNAGIVVDVVENVM